MPKVQKYGRYCCLCSNKERRKVKSTFGFHKFPGDKSVRALWMKFCNLSENDDVTKLYICSEHFKPDDFLDPIGKELTGQMTLKKGSVPSVLCQSKQMQSDLAVKRRLSESQAFHPQTREEYLLEMEATIGVSDAPSTSTNVVKNVQYIIEDPVNVTATSADEKKEHEMLDSENTSTTMDEWSTPKKRKFSEPRYSGDIKSPDVSTPKRARRSLKLALNTVAKQKKKIRSLQESLRCYKKKVSSLRTLLKELQKKNLLNEDSANCLMDMIPESVKQLINKKMRGSRKYSPQLGIFALSLQYYSSKAYNYVRRIWKNLLPHPATLRKWYQVVDGQPGFTKEAFEAISRKTQQNEVIINIVIDEMSIREQMLFFNKRFYGGVDLGTGFSYEGDNCDLAKNALVFMGVALNGGWKVPLGYFLIKSLSGSERANLLTKCLELVNQSGAKVYSITFDGASVNLAMCSTLGANFDYYNNFKPWFLNPVTGEKIFIFLDPCHMVKLVRNTLGDKKVLSCNGKLIKWDYIAKLEEHQRVEGLHVGTKITKKHVNFNDNRMNVKLAVQVLSQSVADALKFMNEICPENFHDCEETAFFLKNFNDIFDILNCKSQFSRAGFRVPLNDVNYNYIYSRAQSLIQYIENLRDGSDNLILKSNRKTGFLGFIICLKSLFNLYDRVKNMNMKYILSFKISQDFLETFFSAVRARGGFNNNPNAKQFESAYKRLLLRHNIKDFDNSNCLADGIDILHVSAKRENLLDPIVDCDISINLFDHDYVCTMWELTPYVENVVKYISGYIVNKLRKLIKCNICVSELSTDTQETSLLFQIKNRGLLINPSEHVSKICLITEKIFRENYKNIFTNKCIHQTLCHYTLMRVPASCFDSKVMNDHILSQQPLDNHKSQLIKTIVQFYLKIRLYHEGKTRSTKEENIRHKYNKLILFKNQ